MTTYKPPYLTYPLPEKDEFKIFEETVTSAAAKTTRTLTIRADSPDMVAAIKELVHRHYKVHGKRPAGLLLGWKAALVYDAQNISYESGFFEDIPVLVSEFVHPMGRSILLPSTPWKLLKALVMEDAVIEGDTYK